MSAMKQFIHYSDVASFIRKPRVVSIGNFDGVHTGHRAVLRAAKWEANLRFLELAVLTFEPHPVEVLIPDAPKLRLVETDRKAELLSECGVDLVLFQRFDDDFADLSARRFAKEVLEEALLSKLVFVGENFRFGHRREAGVDDLVRLGEEMGFEVFGETLIQAGESEVSSSRIRRALTDGDVRAANQMLGRPHEVSGTVKEDRAVGAKMGFPTINLTNINVVIPKPGIYAALCDTDGDVFPAAAYIGDRPTMGAGFSVEAHLLDFDGDLYGQRVTLKFIERVRDDQKFDSAEALTRQIEADVSAIRGILETRHG
jgi:riboflavin kinase / FMN adenylyltransferase